MSRCGSFIWPWLLIPFKQHRAATFSQGLERGLCALSEPVCWGSTGRQQPQIATSPTPTQKTGVGHAAHKGKLERGRLRASSHADSASGTGSLGSILEKSPWVQRWAYRENVPAKLLQARRATLFCAVRSFQDHVHRFLSPKHHSAMTLSPPLR